ncbi:polyphosphate kinase 1 [Ulvibacterium sp.]|uniref:polyphosphate kinase 1 n=1 Tax=Ulvibacterium sp. TaxID=2665914 RepID=UPI003BAB6824
MEKEVYKHRDVNWLFFNERVLLEAADETTPPLERLKFLAIFSSNLDEYFKVRVSQIRQLKKVDKPLRKKLMLRPNKKLKYILKTIDGQQQRFGGILQDILEDLKGYGIHFPDLDSLTDAQKNYASEYFVENMQKDCEILEMGQNPKLLDGQLYLLVSYMDESFCFVKIPTDKHPRFVEIPGEGSHYVFLDSILKMNLERLVPEKRIAGSYSIKLSRDAELYLEDDYGDTALVERIYESLGQRKSGQPTRLLYDPKMPEALRKSLRGHLNLGKVDLFPGGTFHNFSDFFGFDNPTGNPKLNYGKKEPLPHPVLSDSADFFASIAEKDRIVHFPYQSFDSVEKFILTAAQDDGVEHIKITLYRVAKTSVLTDALLTALKNGKKVTLFIEAKARFDERNNIEWGKIFQKQGAQVFFSVPNIKVHSKIALVERREKKILRRYAYIGTGNFNAKTAKLYCDHGLFTAHPQITEDLHQVFSTLDRKLIVPKLKQLLVSPYTTRTAFLQCIENEIKNSSQGKSASINIKMNSLEDRTMIDALYRASDAGVKIRLLVRGFCCLVPNAKNDAYPHREPIQVTSIVDRYLEHGRIYLFENGGDEIMYMGSADWMGRNLDRRIEVLTPILDKEVFKELKHILLLQFSDNVKARIQDAADSNERVRKEQDGKALRSQYAIYDYLQLKLKDEVVD